MTGEACDTHMHFYDARCRTAPGASLRPPDATVAEYRHVQTALGLGRVVVVQPTTYGLDNSCQAAAIAALGDRARGIAVVDSTSCDEDLQALHDQGFRGARFHMLPGGAVGWPELEPVASNIAELGWHVQLQMNGHELVNHLDQLLALPVPLVIDHVGRFMPPVAPDHGAVGPLVELMDAGAHLKLSAPYESEVDDTHRYDTVSSLIERLVERYPEQLLWASNWPHPGQADPPTLQHLAGLRDQWLPTAELQKQVLVTNPYRLYFT